MSKEDNQEAVISETIPSYIRDYLLGARPPENCCVPEDSLPALVEGDLRQARVATVGINPHGGLSRDEYPPLDGGGAEMVWNDKQRYFQKRRYPYFGRLERVLKKCGVSYGGKYDLEDYYPNRLACSLDLVQWPTTPLWSKISKEAQAKLLKDGRPLIDGWRRHYNSERPHSALGNLAPETFALVVTAAVQ